MSRIREEHVHGDDTVDRGQGRRRRRRPRDRRRGADHVLGVLLVPAQPRPRVEGVRPAARRLDPHRRAADADDARAGAADASCGERSWAIPGWLEKILPDITIESPGERGGRRRCSRHTRSPPTPASVAPMAKLKFSISMSLDGYVAGPDQSLENPLGEGGERPARVGVRDRDLSREPCTGSTRGETGLDDEHAARWNENIGATIMGRNMFGPVRGEWGDSDWKGWWGDDPPYHAPVFVLTHHAREPVEMSGGTTFDFVTDGIEAALERAVEAAGGQDVAIGGGAETVAAVPASRAGRRVRGPRGAAPARRWLAALRGPRRRAAGYECVELVSSPVVAHFTLRAEVRSNVDYAFGHERRQTGDARMQVGATGGSSRRPHRREHRGRGAPSDRDRAGGRASPRRRSSRSSGSSVPAADLPRDPRARVRRRTTIG